MAMPDVYSIRHTTVEDYVEPVAHEIKVRRADLLADLRAAHKRAAYLGMAAPAGTCWPTAWARPTTCPRPAA
jgi:hypothetical protein